MKAAYDKIKDAACDNADAQQTRSRLEKTYSK